MNKIKPPFSIKFLIAINHNRRIKGIRMAKGKLTRMQIPLRSICTGYLQRSAERIKENGYQGGDHVPIQDFFELLLGG